MAWLNVRPYKISSITGSYGIIEDKHKKWWQELVELACEHMIHIPKKSSGTIGH